MELFLNNVGIIKESRVLLNGLTVITGKNSSGKTTVGRTMYSLLSAGSNLEEAFENSRRTYIHSQLINVERVLRIRRSRPLHYYREEKEENRLDWVMSVLASRSFTKFNTEELIAFVVELKNQIDILDAQSYSVNINNSRRELSQNDRFVDVMYENFLEWKNKALEILSTTINLISDEKAFYNFLKDRTSAFLNHEFNGQIKPVKYKKYASKIELYDQGKCIVCAKVKSKNYVEFASESSFVYPYDTCIFIDNPYVIDNLERYDVLYHSMYRGDDEGLSRTIITSEDIKDRDEILCDLLTNREKKNYFDDLEIQNKFKDIFEQINKIVPGEFSKNPDGYFYVDDGASLSVKNLATGSKLFFIIKKLLLNGLIDNTTMLILDEPESHLHPEWINKFAEILAFLVKKVNVNVLLTTHSPNLMLALNVYADKMDIIDKSHFYLAEKMENEYFSNIRCIDDSIGEGYAHLSLPLVEMNLELDGLNGD